MLIGITRSNGIIKELDVDYRAEVDCVDKDSWHEILKEFNDANIYQTWSYDSVRYGDDRISHMVLKKCGKVVAVAQARVVKIPFVSVGIAYVRFGPLWHLRGQGKDAIAFCQIIRALRNEYVIAKRMVLRILPFLFYDDSNMYSSVFEKEGYSRLFGDEVSRTILMDLTLPVEDLRRGLKEKWRYNLKQAEKKNFAIKEGVEDELFELFETVYKEMTERKQYVPSIEIAEYRSMQRDLPDNFKMHLIICLLDDVPCAGIICGAIGNTGIFLFGATSNNGLKSKGSYLLQWKAIEWLKHNNFTSYDLNGINPEKNPGTYQFKSGLSGKNGREGQFIGRFDTYNSGIDYLLITWAEKALRRLNKIREFVSKDKK
jgi:hypothetical protein